MASTASIDDLPDSDFAYIEPGGKKDASGKTTPRSLRHFPIHDADHVRNALARLDQSPFGAKARPKVEAAARKFGIGMAAKAEFIKAEQLTGSKWRALAIPFGGPKNGKDLDGEFFDRDTDIKPHWFKARPVLFHHGKDRAAKDEDYGEQELDDQPSDDGWWSTLWLNRSAKYWAMVDQWLRDGRMYGSSGAISHLVRTNKATGHIDVWPHAEQTLTPTPINFYARITASKALEDFDTAGIAVDDQMKDVIAELDRLAASLDTPLTESPNGISGGSDPAMSALAAALADLEEALKK